MPIKHQAPTHALIATKVT
uniref:Uncharacterized protein n=1 Tax=Arundo donax TaxID=35708 RepID=A0A0A9G408_ARUDO